MHCGLRARRTYFGHLLLRAVLPAVPLFIAITALWIGHISSTAYLWTVVPLWYFVNVLTMVFPFSVLFPSPHTRCLSALLVATTNSARAGKRFACAGCRTLTTHFLLLLPVCGCRRRVVVSAVCFVRWMSPQLAMFALLITSVTVGLEALTTASTKSQELGWAVGTTVFTILCGCGLPMLLYASPWCDGRFAAWLPCLCGWEGCLTTVDLCVCVCLRAAATFTFPTPLFVFFLFLTLALCALTVFVARPQLLFARSPATRVRLASSWTRPLRTCSAERRGCGKCKCPPRRRRPPTLQSHVRDARPSPCLCLSWPVR